MKRLLFLLFVIPVIAFGQPGYTNRLMKDKLIATLADSTTHIPAGQTASLRGGAARSGALFYDSTGGNKGLYIWTGINWLKIPDTTQVSINANNGLILSSSVTQLGQTLNAAGNPAVMTTSREIPFPATGSIYLKFRDTTTTYYSQIGPAEFITSGPLGGGVTTYIQPGAGHALPSYSFYRGTPSSSTFLTGLGLDYQGGFGGHVYLDMRDSISYFAIEGNPGGISLANFVNQSGGYVTQLGLKGPSSFGPTAYSAAQMLALGYLSSQKSFYAADSVMFAKKSYITDSTGYDILMSQRASPYMTKNMTVADLRTIIGAGGGSTNTGVGSGYQVAINATNNIKSLANTYGMILDSATSNQVGFKVDTATINALNWLRAGSIVADGTNVLGTLNNKSFLIYTNNTRVGKWDSTGCLSINVTTPSPSILGTNDAKLLVQGTVGLYESGTLKTYWGLSSSNAMWVMRNSSAADAIKLLTTTGGTSWIGNENTMKFGVGTASPTSTLYSGGSFGAKYAAITSTYSITAQDYSLEATSGTFTATLPTAVSITGRVYFITNSGSGVLTLGTTSSQTFVNQSGTPTTITLNQFGGVMVQSNGANWIVLSKF